MAERKLPNLFVIGAMKSGTTSLHNWLGQHPEIFMSSVKEPGFFVEQLTWKKGWSWYQSLFADAGDAKVIGESSTEYTKLPYYKNVVGQIEKHAPDAKFIYLMRDPIERTISHYWHNVRSRNKNDRRDLMTALKNDAALIHFSNYAQQLVPYFDAFGADRVFVLTMEELLADPQTQISKMFEWYQEDFSINQPLIDYLNKYSNTQINDNAKISYLEYDWNLNGI